MGQDLARTLTRKDLLLLLLYAPGKHSEERLPVRGRTRLAKMVFLFREELWKPFRFDRLLPEHVLPNFRPWKFGPYSKEVFSDVEFLRSVGFLESVETAGPASKEEALELGYWSASAGAELEDEPEPGTEGFVEEVFQLSAEGNSYVEHRKLWDMLSREQKQSLREFKERMCRAPLYAILSYVYEKYPESAEKSEVRERYLSS